MKYHVTLVLCLLFLASCAAHAPKKSTTTQYIQEYHDLDALYQRFLAFKDDPEFIKEGFVEGSSYLEWIQEVQGLQKKTGYSTDGPRILTILAMATRQEGPESKITQQAGAKLQEILNRAKVKPNAVYSFLYTGDTRGVLTDQKTNGKPLGGLARRAPVVTELREQETHSVLVDAGDAFVAGGDNEKVNETLIDVMNRLKYDAMGLGPDDIELGEEVLRKLSEQAEFPFICSSLLFDKPENAWVKPYTIVERGGASIAIMSLLPPLEDIQIANSRYIEPQQIRNLYFSEIKNKAQFVVLLTQYEGSELAKILLQDDPINIVFCDAKGKPLDAPKYIFPTVSKGQGLGYFRFEKIEGGTFRPFSQIMIPLNGEIDADIQKIINKIKS